MHPHQPVWEAHPLSLSALLWPQDAPPAGLYVHVPFCRSICTYCAFAKAEYQESAADAWLDGLAREISVRTETTWSARPRIDTLFLGGGTPSALTVAQWRRLGQVLHDGFSWTADAEVTSEANPESFTPVIAEAMRAAGINRVSLGAQSLQAAELAVLGRPHGAAGVATAVQTARDAGFENLSLDLMYGLPDQSLAAFADSLGRILDLGPDHLSAYCLGLEPGTELAQRKAAGTLGAIDDDLAGEQHETLIRVCADAGLGQYEISNFARPGYACRHNLRYWQRTDFMALGPSSHALLANHRWANPAPLAQWLAAYAPGGKPPTPKPVPEPTARFEWMFLNLRLMAGLSADAYTRTWDRSLTDDYGPVLERLVHDGLLLHNGDRLRLAPAAQFVSDAVFAEFAPDAS